MVFVSVVVLWAPHCINVQPDLFGVEFTHTCEQLCVISPSYLLLHQSPLLHLHPHSTTIFVSVSLPSGIHLPDTTVNSALVSLFPIFTSHMKTPFNGSGSLEEYACSFFI